MVRLLTIGALVAGGVLFGWGLTLGELSRASQPLIVAISIMAAALLVRLNRGMPAIDWRSLEVHERKLLTAKVVALTREYMIVLLVQGFALLVLLILSLKQMATLSHFIQQGFVAIAGGLIGLAVARMAYIVWRDYDIVRLQKKLIDESADREAVDKASAEALSKVTAIRASGLRGSGSSQPKQ